MKDVETQPSIKQANAEKYLQFRMQVRKHIVDELKLIGQELTKEQWENKVLDICDKHEITLISIKCEAETLEAQSNGKTQECYWNLKNAARRIEVASRRVPFSKHNKQIHAHVKALAIIQTS